MNKDFHSQSDTHADSQAAEQFNEIMNSAEQEFTLGDEKKPMNRNVIGLVLIAAVGALLVYIMYARGGFAGSAADTQMQGVEDRVNNMIGDDGKAKLRELEGKLDRTKQMVASFQVDSAQNQVPPERLKVNPFAFDDKKEQVAMTITAPTGMASDPVADVKDAVSKVKVQSILFSASNSTCLVNNKIYAEGQKLTVDGITFTIRNIEADHIVLHHPLGKFNVGLIEKGTLR